MGIVMKIVYKDVYMVYNKDKIKERTLGNALSVWSQAVQRL